MLIDYGKNRWEFNTVDEAVFVAKDLIKTLKASYGIDLTIPETKTVATDKTVKVKASKEIINDNE